MLLWYVIYYISVGAALNRFRPVIRLADEQIWSGYSEVIGEDGKSIIWTAWRQCGRGN